MLQLPEVYGLVILMLLLAGVGLAIFSAGKTRQRDLDSVKETTDVETARAVEREVDSMSDDDIRKRMLADWAQPESVSGGQADKYDPS